MVKIAKESINQAKFEMEPIDDSWQIEYNLREVVKECFYLIQNARKYKVSWERIAEIIRRSAGITDGISPSSISKYYSELKKHPENLPKKNRKKSTSKKKETSSDQDTSSEKSVTSTDTSSNKTGVLSETLDNASDKISEVAIESQIEPSCTEESKAKGKSKFGASYESGDKKAADEFNC